MSVVAVPYQVGFCRYYLAIASKCKSNKKLEGKLGIKGSRGRNAAFLYSDRGSDGSAVKKSRTYPTII